MARVTTSALISDIRGSIQGSTFQGSQGGLVLKRKPNPLKKRTTSQSNVRNVQAACQQAWQSLSASDREVWNQFALYYRTLQRNSVTRTLTGQQLYLQGQYYHYNALGTFHAVPAFQPRTYAPVTASLALSGSDLTFTFSRTVPSADEVLILYMTYITSLSKNNPSGLYRMIPQYSSALTGLIINTPYLTVFPTIPAAGQQVFFKLATLDLDNMTVSSFYEDKVTL